MKYVLILTMLHTTYYSTAVKTEVETFKLNYGSKVECNKEASKQSNKLYDSQSQNAYSTTRVIAQCEEAK